MNDTTRRLVEAYEKMLARARHELEELQDAEHGALPDLRRRVERAAEQAVELGELTRDEATQIAGYLRRDLEDAGAYLARTGNDLGRWLRFDLDLIEDRLQSLLLGAADQTRLELLELAADLERASHYHTGEITGPGALRCEQCGEVLHFRATGRIPPCPRCHTTAFARPEDDVA